MTTATVMDPRKQKDREFAYGSGQINPVQAVSPGLVFDASEADYVNFLCKQGYNTTTLQLLTGDSSVCNGTTPGRGWDQIKQIINGETAKQRCPNNTPTIIY
ncbi:Cucumisin [Heracleum sosnowskyi]|uniref:Cucumisin n=1 Tax=Heracleum sosnowskyi TaxID=360622 RepID=A0AAD8IGS8_9APIA|nr:Cucumisin [Heracleum sosnowskyi]